MSLRHSRGNREAPGCLSAASRQKETLIPSRIATVVTSRARSNLQQLCKHFGHKVPVDFTPEAGEITLPFGTCTLRATDDTLTLVVTGDADNLERLEEVITSHLERFAFR